MRESPRLKFKDDSGEISCGEISFAQGGLAQIGGVPDLLTWVLDQQCEFIAIHEESKDDIMHHD